ncbi:tetratricopeptide repeat protein [Gracilimonas halophila]|uniref:Tetratricopeptide repeat protein n=1 Tax=Gracilimonas halophila TaxID=1834464 RepID=A0ABW5JLP9_9BACT
MKFRKLLIGAFAVLIFTTAAFAQNSRQFQLAVQLMQQQEYAEALPILLKLNEDNPEIYPIADRLIDCYIQLKQYDEALEITHQYAENNELARQVTVRTGELYHYKGEEERALEIWETNLEENPNDLQLYMNTARVMTTRREYLSAVDIYKQARVQFQNNRIFFGDIANAYMQAGEYELAIEEWLALLEDSPGQISFIQRSLLRYNDPILYDITIVELNDRLADMSVSAPLFQTFYQLQVWLLQENKLYRRALATAKEYEDRTNSFNYSLFNLGRQLIRNNEFELAQQAFTYYTDNAYGEVKWRGLEELSNTYSSWAKFIDDYNLDFSNQKDSLYQLATVMLDSIEQETNIYSGMERVQLKRAELALDHVFDLDKAEAALRKLKSIPGSAETPEASYIEGRIYLSKKEYAQARINLTRANKKADIGEIAERSRYFLALTDFYSGDYEFANIQLKSLGRNNTSYYANDAIELRLWLQEGQSADTTGENLERFADAVFKFNNGASKESTQLFLSLINDPAVYTMKDDAILFYVRSTHIPDTQKLIQLSNFLAINTNTPIMEKLMWEQAKLAEQVNINIAIQECENSEDCFFDNSSGGSGSKTYVSAREIYEELILKYPQGFYAPYARERLTKLANQNS